MSGVQQCTNSAVAAGCAEGISSGEEPDLIDGSFMSGKFHLTVPGAGVPHTDTAVRTLHREAGQRARQDNEHSSRSGVHPRSTTHSTHSQGERPPTTHRGGKHAKGVAWVESNAAQEGRGRC